MVRHMHACIENESEQSRAPTPKWHWAKSTEPHLTAKPTLSTSLMWWLTGEAVFALIFTFLARDTTSFIEFMVVNFLRVSGFIVKPTMRPLVASRASGGEAKLTCAIFTHGRFYYIQLNTEFAIWNDTKCSIIHLVWKIAHRMETKISATPVSALERESPIAVSHW